MRESLCSVQNSSGGMASSSLRLDAAGQAAWRADWGEVQVDAGLSVRWGWGEGSRVGGKRGVGGGGDGPWAESAACRILPRVEVCWMKNGERARSIQRLAYGGQMSPVVVAWIQESFTVTVWVSPSPPGRVPRRGWQDIS